MSELLFSSALTVELVQSTGNDDSVVWAAQVSTLNDLKPNTVGKTKGLISYLIKHRHGSPFEHNTMTFRIKAPIFVAREFFRHRIGWSYNEQSGRYTKFEPEFYVYPDDRPLMQAGSGAHPDLQNAGGPLQHQINAELTAAAYSDWRRYEHMLSLGAANEVARSVLPVGIYTTFYATCNARSLMAFLSLRVDSPDNTIETKPQWEIQQVAEAMEKQFRLKFPYTHQAFVENGRVAP